MMKDNGKTMMKETKINNIVEADLIPASINEYLPDNKEVIEDNTNVNKSQSDESFIDPDILKEIAEIQAAIESDDQAIDVPDTAAGQALIDGGRSAGVKFERDAEEVIASSSFQTAALDNADNTSIQPTATALFTDTSAIAPTITIAGDTSFDGIYNAAELATGAAGTVTATIAIPSDAVAGDKLTYTVDGETAEIELTDANIATGIPIEVLPETTITATITDNAGNISTQGTATASASDTSVAAATISVDSTGNDSVYNSRELGDDGTVTATISLPSDAVANDFISINGATARAITAEEITASEITFEVAPGTTVTAQIIDQAGNDSATTTVTASPSDTSVAAPTITIDSTGNDSIYNAKELGDDGTVTATIAIPDDANVGDILTYTVDDGTTEVVVELTAGNIAAGIPVEVLPEATITATITDIAGNTSNAATATAFATDSTIATPTVILEAADVNGDSLYNAAELGSDGTVTAIIGVTGSDVGDTLIYTINGVETVVTLDANNIRNGVTIDIDPVAFFQADTNTPVEVELTAENIASGINVAILPEATITATITDIAGNTSDTATATAFATDSVIATPTVTLEAADTNGDSVYNADELGPDGTVTAIIGVTGSEAGDTLTYTVDGVATVITLAAGNIENGVTIAVAPEAVLTATLSDSAGNTSNPVTATALATALSTDSAIATPTVTIEAADANDDSVYNAAELGIDGTVSATIGVTGAEVGDILTYTVDEVATVVTLDADDIVNGVTIDIDPEAVVTATLSDIAGNTSDAATATALTVDTDVNAPIITIAGDVNNDGVYNAAELAAGAAGTVTATITMPGDAVAGDILTYQVGTDSPVD
ncbi:beta strand repeat-containing protein, partial [Colwellia sp. C1TZA3]|uniref:beta strand repeat-containing protein n=1 Tax=Colwellia sp. C1TZA3 TaxID=2508879 RepID=UPI0011BA2444